MLEVAAIIGIMVALCNYVPYFYLLAWATEIACVVRIIASDDNPDYKIPWLLFVLILPIAGFMLYFIFYSRTLQKRFIKRLNTMRDRGYKKDDSELFAQMKAENPRAYSQAKMLCNISDAHLFTNTKQTYFPLGDNLYPIMLHDLAGAQKFVYLEYFTLRKVNSGIRS